MSGLEHRETERMTLEALGVTHRLELIALLGDPRVAEWLAPSGVPVQAAEIPRVLTRKQAHWREHGFGFWLLRDRADGAMVGWGGLQQTTATGTPEVEIGWAIVPERWGQGLASELAQASVGAAFDELGLADVIAFTRPDNAASRRVMEKAKLRYEREFEHAGRPHVLYRRTRC